MRALTLAVLLPLVATACGGAGTPAATARRATAPPAAATPPAPAAVRPVFLTASLTDVRTGAPFTIGGFSGKVVLVIAMAVW
jgi:hypothetical protein